MKIIQTVFNLRNGHMVEMAMFNVQRAITPKKVGKPVTVHEFCTSSQGALNLNFH